MGTAALTARIALPAARRNAHAARCGLAFDQQGGPIVALCGLVGGSGCSTIAYLLARQAARESQAPVLLTELNSRGGGLAVLAGQATPHSLASLARRLAARDVPEASFAELEPRLRLLAATPQRASAPESNELRALLREARAAHGLVVVDCGTGGAPADSVLIEATHIIWTLPATTTAVARAGLLLASDALPPPGRAREALVVSALDRTARPSVRALRRLAARRCERLVLSPRSDALARGELAERDERMLRALSGLAPMLRRSA